MIRLIIFIIKEYTIDYLNSLLKWWFLKTKLKLAYKGYLHYQSIELENVELSEPLSFEEFKNFDFWKIEMSYRIYLHKYKGVSFWKPSVYQIKTHNMSNDVYKTIMRYGN